VFDKIVFALELNEVSKAFATENDYDSDYYIVKRTGDKTPVRIKPLEEVRGCIYERLETKAIDQMLWKHFATLKDNANVVYLINLNDLVLPDVK